MGRLLDSKEKQLADLNRAVYKANTRANKAETAVRNLEHELRIARRENARLHSLVEGVK
jgi:predicted  nucleic acid-binding Zn-ribbon protein